MVLLKKFSYFGNYRLKLCNFDVNLPKFKILNPGLSPEEER
jgi:hypothetical protein